MAAYARKCRFLQTKIGMYVDLRGVDVFMPEAERDDGLIDARMQQLKAAKAALLGE